MASDDVRQSKDAFALFFHNLMQFISLVSSVVVVIILTYFNYNFVKEVIIINNWAFALILAISVEGSKTATSYFAGLQSANNSQSATSWLITASLRIVAIVLSTIFCVTEVTSILNRPNERGMLEKAEQEINSKYRNQEELIKQSANQEREALERQLNNPNYPNYLKPEINRQLQNLRENTNRQISELYNNKDREADTKERKIRQSVEGNNPKLNGILSILFDTTNGTGMYQVGYNYLVLFTALLLTLFLELSSITLIQSLSHLYGGYMKDV
jgi:hypothetical protein